MSSENQKVALPAYFPLVRKDCEKQAESFFQCLSEKTDCTGALGNAEAALQSCMPLQVLYSKCTEASLNAKGAKQPAVLTKWERPMSKYQGTGVRVAIVHARWNSEVVDALVDACRETLFENGVTELTIESVGGAFELPFAAAVLARSKRFDVIIPIGCLIKGDTMHFEYISGASVDGLMRVGLDTGIPIINGILNVLTQYQALERAGLAGVRGNEAVGWAETAIQQAQLVNKYTV